MINIPPFISGGNSFHFFPKIFPEIFYEYVTCGIDPPFYPLKTHIWGGYGGGEGVHMVDPPMPLPKEGTYCQ